MASTPRLLGMTLLAVFGSLSGSSQPPAPKAEPPAAPAPEFNSNPGIAMIEHLLVSLGKFDQDGHPAGQKVGFEIPEKALNDYLAFSLRNKPRPGISAMTVTLLPQNQISADVEIDFDSVKKWNPGMFPEAMSGLLTGKRTVHADVTFESKDGSVTFQLKDAKGPDGTAIVNKMMSSMLQSLGSRQPESYDTSKPIPLPFGLKRVWTGRQLICGET